MRKKGLAATGMAPLFPTTTPRAEPDWQTGDGDGSQCDASGQHIASSFSYFTHTRANDQRANCLPHAARGLSGDTSTAPDYLPSPLTPPVLQTPSRQPASLDINDRAAE